MAALAFRMAVIRMLKRSTAARLALSGVSGPYRTLVLCSYRCDYVSHMSCALT